MGKVINILIFSFCVCAAAVAQKKVEYKADGAMEFFKRKGEKVRRLTDNVVFTQKETKIYCDSAFFYRERNAMEAFGRVRIVDDSVTITSKRLYYKGNERKAELRENVVYTKGQSRLMTDSLNYDMDKEISHYFNGGTLQDTTNTLTSEIGYFYALDDYATFTNNVVLVSPTYTLKSEKLRYNTVTKVATTPTETEIISNDGQSTIFADGGEFITELDQSMFVEGKVETPNNFLEGDDLFFDQQNKYYKAEGNVKLIAKNKDIIITGDEGYNDKANGISKIYGNPVMKKPMNTDTVKMTADTLYMSADTLIYVESQIDSLKMVYGYYNAKVYKGNLQGYADSTVYHVKDSVLFMYHDPILWNENNQTEADTIKVTIRNNAIDKMYLRKNAFMASEDTLKNYNQIKGRNMIAYFKNQDIDQMDVNGNGEVIYYVLTKGDSATLGMNRILCSNLKLRFKNRNLSNISAYVKPEARFIPPHELTPDVQKLKGFNWRGPERPTLYDVLNNVSREEKQQKQEPPKDKSQIPFDGEKRPESILRPKNVKKGEIDGR